MLCVAERRAQVNTGTKKNPHITTFDEGMTQDFDECPPGFRVIEGTPNSPAPPIDFGTAGEEELMERDFNIDSLRQYLAEIYDLKPGNRGKEKLIAMLLDARYRDIDNRHLESTEAAANTESNQGAEVSLDNLT